jgi:tRNA modification GTPase
MDKENCLIDEAILIYFKAPFSFTAEDVVEIQCHGGFTVAQIILEEVLKNGARLAQPGEFSKRAFLNGRIDLSEAEAIAKLIETKSVEAAKILSKQMKGQIKDFVSQTRENLIEILAFVEVNIDYAEEDLPLDLLNQIQARLNNLELELENLYASSQRRESLLNGFKVSIVGKPNVGKSSLLNSLLNYDRAIISEIAGTTRDTIEEEIRLGTHLIKIVDTAGIREASDSIERIGIERSQKAIEESDIVLVMFDNSRKFDDEDKKILQLLKNYEGKKQILFIINKIDLEAQLDRTSLPQSSIEFSCKQNNLLLIQTLEKLLDSSNSQDGLLLISKRQMHAVHNAFIAIKEAKEVLNEGELELFAFHLNEAIEAISSISTNFDRDEILEKMFGSFCLGK